MHLWEGKAMSIQTQLKRQDLEASAMLGFEQMLCGEQTRWDCERQESGRRLTFELIFVDSQAFDFRVQGWSWETQFDCRTISSGDTAATFR